MRGLSMLALAGALVLAGCNGSRDQETVPEENVVNELEEAPANVVSSPRTEEQPNASAPENRVEAPQISEEQQIQDDAEASGMTSRLPDDSETWTPVRNGMAGDQPGSSPGSSSSAGQR